MMLLEHHAKQVLAERGMPVPAGRLLRADDETTAPSLPIVVKAQVPVGGRGKAGGIVLVEDKSAFDQALSAIMGMTIKGHTVRAVRLESPVEHVGEAYLSFTVDPGRGDVRVLMSAAGGVDVEGEAALAYLHGQSAELDGLGAAVDELAALSPAETRVQLQRAGHALAAAFLETGAISLEINPLFLLPDGGWIIGDAKLSIDENALPCQPRLQAIIQENADLYPEASLKLAHGFDFVHLDEGGDIGLVTTGAGLSMQLIDELVVRGHRPFNFCDIRTGQFKGDPARLIQVLEWIAAGKGIRSVLINVFAGGTDLGELARLLLIAIKAVPGLRAPITARLVGNGLEEAKRIIAEAGDPIRIETDLEVALALATERADRREVAHA